MFSKIYNWLNRRVLLLGLAALSIRALTPLAEGATQQPNVLWIIAEDMSPEWGCYGYGAIETPNVDRLAREGVRFTNVYGTSGVCSANRSAFGTGMYQTSIGAHNHRTRIKQPLPDGVLPISEHFRKAGYFVSNGWQDRETVGAMDRPGKVDWNFKIDGAPFDGVDWSERAPGQPFFAQVYIDESHRPWTRDMEEPIKPEIADFPPYYPDHPLMRIDWALYLEEVQVFDRLVGRILDRLEREGLSKNTIVFVFSDNGRPFCRDKGYVYDGGLRVPLIIRWPDAYRAGEVERRLISMIDLGPTAMEMAEIPIPETMQGRPFVGDASVERQIVFAAKDRIGTVPDRVRVARGIDFKYLRNDRTDLPYLPINRYSLVTHPSLAAILKLKKEGEMDRLYAPLVASERPAEELYDLRVDPYEMNNLADDSTYEWVLNNFRGHLDRWVQETGDMGREFESEEAIAAYDEWLDDYLTKILSEMGVENLNPEEMYEYWVNKFDL